jgi:hypothetical protein
MSTIGITVPSNIDPEQILPVKDLARQTGLEVRTIRDWIYKGVLPRTKIGPHRIGIRWKHFLEIIKDMPRAS